MPIEDYILKNIRTHLRQENLKMENVSKEIGISTGEFSKILSGQRRDYYKYLPKIAEILGINFHELVKPNSNSINNSRKTEGQLDYINNTYQNSSMDLYERVIAECKDKDKLKDEIIGRLQQNLTYWNEKYYRIKTKLEIIEMKKN